jgi:hypothetical protein
VAYLERSAWILIFILNLSKLNNSLHADVAMIVVPVFTK